MIAIETKTQTYTIDPAHSTVNFTVRHLMISKVHGSFKGVTGTVAYDPTEPQNAALEATIDIATVTTGVEQRDAHLKSADFFDVAQFPQMIYRSRSVKRAAYGELEIVGDLTLHGVTREVVLRAEITDEIPSPFGGYKVGVSAQGKLNREDFGMTWNQVIEAGGVAVGKDIAIQIDVELDRPA